jgi:DNA-3-methyladenine glycosylase I
VTRCAWADTDPLLAAYHDEEWGVAEHDDHRLFELLSLEGAQAGLSWLTILRKRDGYRRAFAGFDPAAVACFGPGDVERLLADPGIVRHRGKIESTIDNARAVLAVQEEHGSFAGFVGGAPRDPRALSRALKQAGFRFVGPTTCESFMEAAGLLDHHEPDCFRHGANA